MNRLNRARLYNYKPSWTFRKSWIKIEELNQPITAPSQSLSWKVSVSGGGDILCNLKLGRPCKLQQARARASAGSCAPGVSNAEGQTVGCAQLPICCPSLIHTGEELTTYM